MSCLALLLGLAACGTAQPPEPQTKTLLCTASAWYTEEGPEDSIGSQLDPDGIHVGLTYDGKRIFAFLRPSLEGLEANEVQNARLWLKIKESNGVPALQAGLITGPWDEGTTLKQARALVKELRPAGGPRDEEGGWFSIDVTECVIAWLDGAPNDGLALFEAAPSTETVFASCSSDNCSKLVITTI